MEVSCGMRKRKGQWLLITALIFSLTLTTIVLMGSRATDSADIAYGDKNMFDNIMAESQDAVNVILSENRTSEYLETGLAVYVEFLKRYVNEHNSDISGFYVVGLPSGDDLNLTVANFLGAEMQGMNLSLGGTEFLNLQLDDGNFSTFRFVSVPDSFLFSCNFTYVDDDGDIVGKNHQFNMTRRVFDVFDVRMESGSEIWRDCEIN